MVFFPWVTIPNFHLIKQCSIVTLYSMLESSAEKIYRCMLTPAIFSDGKGHVYFILFYFPLYHCKYLSLLRLSQQLCLTSLFVTSQWLPSVVKWNNQFTCPNVNNGFVLVTRTAQKMFPAFALPASAYLKFTLCYHEKSNMILNLRWILWHHRFPNIIIWESMVWRR